VAALDYDGDGWLDLYLTGYGANSLYHNNGDGTFSEMARAEGVAYEDWSSGSAFADFDGDGDLDFYLSNYVELGSTNSGAIEELAQRTCIWRNIEVFCGPQGCLPLLTGISRTVASRLAGAFLSAAQRSAWHRMDIMVWG
jgi:hypothetical protein